MWSGNPNLALTVEVEGTAPARALEVGCGEGADAVWLARQGWTVTAIDPSGVALERARAAAEAAGADVTWLQGGLLDVDLPEGGFDLVSVFYPALDLDDDPVARLAALVAPGGTLLVVHHAEVDRERALEHGFDPDLLLSPAIVADRAAGGRRLDRRRAREARPLGHRRGGRTPPRRPRGPRRPHPLTPSPHPERG